MPHQTLTDIALKLELQREAQRRARDAGVHVVWTKERYPYTDGINVYLPTLEGVKITEQIKNKYKGYLIHEPLHISRRELLIKCHEENLSNLHTYVVNVVEDELMEADHVLNRHVPGDGMVLDNMIQEEIMRMADSIALDPLVLNDNDPQLKAWAALMGMYKSRVTTWYKNPNTSKAIDKIASFMTEGLREVYDYVLSLNEKGELYKSLTKEHSWDVAEDIYNRFFKDQDNQEQEQEETSDGQGEGDSQEGEGDSEDSEGNGQQPGNIKEIAKEHIKETLDKHNKTTKKLQTYTPQNSTGATSNNFVDLQDTAIDLKGLEEKGVLATYPMNVHIIKTLDELYKEVNVTSSPFNVTQHRDIITKIRELTPSLGTKLKRLLLIKSKASLKGAQKTGKLHNKNLFRAAMPIVGDGEWNTRVFKRRSTKDTLDTSVHILMDFSGSMAGDKCKAACVGVGVLSNTLSALKVPHSIHAYTTTYGNSYAGYDSSVDPVANGRGMPVTIQIKKEKAKTFNLDEAMRKICSMGIVMQQNADADSLLYVASQAKKSPKKRKIIIVISDGAPTMAYTSSSHCEPVLREAAKMIERDPAYELGAIGIGSRSGVSHFYSNFTEISVYDIDKLPVVIMELFKKLILAKKGA